MALKLLCISERLQKCLSKLTQKEKSQSLSLNQYDNLIPSQQDSTLWQVGISHNALSEYSILPKPLP